MQLFYAVCLDELVRLLAGGQKGEERNENVQTLLNTVLKYTV